MTTRPLISGLIFLLSLQITAGSAAAQIKKIALLVGVENYDKRGFSNLEYAEDDMVALSNELEKNGFQVTLLLGGNSDETKRATNANITAVFKESFLPACKALNKSDITLVAFAGHGRHQNVSQSGMNKEDHFYCPVDAHDKDHTTWISITQLVQELEEQSGSESNLILVDACRDNPSRGRGVDGKGFTLNRDAVAVLFAASYNEQAYEPASLKHGLFSYYVIQGLQGHAKNFEGSVTWDSLVDYVKTNVTRKSAELKSKNEIDGTQRPNQAGNLRGESPVLTIQKFLTKPKNLSGEEIVARNIQAAGGVEKFKTIQTMRVISKWVYPQPGLVVRVEEKRGGPNRYLKTIVINQNGNVSQKFEGIFDDVGWAYSSTEGVRLMTAQELNNLKRDTDFRSYYDLNFRYKSIERSDDEEIEGQACYQVKLTDHLGNVERRFYSIESGFIVATKGTAKTDNGDVPVLAMHYDHRSVGDFRMAFRTLYKFPDGEFEDAIEKLEINPTFDPGTFDLPEAVLELVDEN